MRELLAAGIVSLLATMSGVHVEPATHHSGTSINVDGDEVSTCDDMNIRFDHAKGVMTSEELNVGDLRSLKVVSEDHGGIRVVGWDQPRYAVTACKAAALNDTLRGIRVSVRGDEVRADGPDDENWIVFYLVRAPRNATLDLTTKNGPISVRDLDGTIAAHALNGPVSVKHANGTFDLSTVNGPISYSGTSGSVKLNATNGPIAVRLGGDWNGSLDAHGENGPISLRVPQTFNARVVATTTGMGPIGCHSPLCRDASRAMRDAMNDDERGSQPHTMSFGNGAGNVTLSTVNGPIGVKELDE